MADARPTLSAETLDSIRARLLTNANLGKDPTSANFLDAVVGSIYGDLEGPAALELDEFYDAADLAVAQAIPITATGEHLDDWAESLGLERRDETSAGGALHFTGTPGTAILTNAAFSTVAVLDDEPISYTVTAGGVIPGGGSIDLDVVAVVPGSTGNQPAASVTLPASEIVGLASVTNLVPMTGGADIETDEILSVRVADALAGGIGPGTKADYRRWLLNRPGIGFVTVVPAARGAGTLDVYITDLNNDPVPTALVTSTQAWLDPNPGLGDGQAPIGHDVLVKTPTPFAITVAATVTHKAGYSLTGAAGTRATQADITASVRRYIDGLDVGEDVARSKVISAIDRVVGVDRVTTSGGGQVTINAATTETVAVAADAVAYTLAVNLT